MPGIAGILEYKSSAQTAQRLETMVTCLQREPNDRVGTIRQDDLNLRAGWVSGERDFSAIFPLWNEQRDICLVFFGEDFTESHRIERLISDGHILNSDRSDYLIHLYEEKGPGFIEKLNGNFSGLLIDLRQKLVLLFNDRYGLNRIYFYEDATGLYFSSEAKSLLKTFPALRSLDIKSLGEFLSCGCVLQNRTLFGGINLVPGGSLWTFTPGGPVKKQSYFSPDSWEAQDALSAGEYYRKLKQTWMDLLPRYFRGKRPIGVSLTGGIDSRMILAWAPPSAGSLACYTFGGHFRDCADVKISRRIARICRHNHELIPVGSQFLSRFAPLAEQAVYLSDGAMDVTGAIDLYLQEMARQIAPIRITGTNGGEVLRSLIAFKPNGFRESALEPGLSQSVEDAALTYAQELNGRRLSFTAFKQAAWFMGSKFVLERSQLCLRMPYFDNDLIALVYRAPTDLATSKTVSWQLIAEGNPELGRIGTDRAAGARSLPAFALAQRLVKEFTFKAEYAYDYGMPQWLAKIDHAVSALRLEHLFLGRHRFAHFRLWYRDQLADYLKQILLDPRTLRRPCLRRVTLERMVADHTKGTANHTATLHKLLTLELIQRQLLERN